MSIAELREELEGLRPYVTGQGVAKLDRALSTLDRDRLLTTTEAAEVLGIRSVNTLKLLVRQRGLRYELHGNRMMIPLSELERLQGSDVVRGIQASDQAHETIAALGTPEGLSAEQMDDLEAARPGRLPWGERVLQHA